MNVVYIRQYACHYRRLKSMLGPSPSLILFYFSSFSIFQITEYVANKQRIYGSVTCSLFAPIIHGQNHRPRCVVPAYITECKRQNLNYHLVCVLRRCLSALESDSPWKIQINRLTRPLINYRSCFRWNYNVHYPLSNVRIEEDIGYRLLLCWPNNIFRIWFARQSFADPGDYTSRAETSWFGGWRI